MIVALNVITTTNNDGRPVVLLPLKNSTRKVVVDTQSFKDLMDMGIKLPLILREGFVCVHFFKEKKRKYVKVARLVRGAGPNERVFYADMDRLNLTKSNLILHEGGNAKKDEIVPKNIEYKISHKH